MSEFDYIVVGAGFRGRGFQGGSGPAPARAMMTLAWRAADLILEGLK